MLPRAASLKKFSRKFPHSRFTKLLIVNTRDSAVSKLIVTVPKKTCPLAVDRNRSRRLVTAAFLKINSQSPISKEVAVLVRQNLKDTHLSVIEKELQDALK